MELIFCLVIGVNTFSFVIRPEDCIWGDRAYKFSNDGFTKPARYLNKSAYILCFNENDATTSINFLLAISVPFSNN